MAIPFSRSMRSMQSDGSRRSTVWLVLVFVLLGAWTAWLFLARISLYETTATARVEVAQAVTLVQAPVAGKVAETRLTLGEEVARGAILLVLDSEAETLRLREDTATRDALRAQLGPLRTRMAAIRAAREREREAARQSVAEAQNKHKGAEAEAKTAEERLTELEKLGGDVTKDELREAKLRAVQARTKADALGNTVRMLQSQLGQKESEHDARLADLGKEESRLRGEIETRNRAVDRIEAEIKRRTIRAPVAGRIGEISRIQIGTVLRAGDFLAALVPHGKLRGIAEFSPAAVGKIRPRQEARIRLAGFPWTQYGTVPATVERVASEAQEGRVRVELSLHPEPRSRIALQHGLPGSVEVEVERVSPFTLVLRAAGRFLEGDR